MLKVATVSPNEPYREYKDVERVYSGSTEIDKILDKNGNVLFAVNKGVEGTPAITYKGKEETNLKNYRIYGQTVDGESVGEKTANLFDGEIEQGSVKVIDGAETNSGSRIRTKKISVKPITTYTISSHLYIRAICLYNDGVFISTEVDSPTNANHQITLTMPNNANQIQISFKNSATDTTDNSALITPDDFEWGMLNSGSTALPYEPYGYKVPVTVSDGTDTLTTPIYLPEPIKMVGDEAEYIDFMEQKQHRVRKNLVQNTAISKTTAAGLTITVNSDKSVIVDGTTNDGKASGVVLGGNTVLGKGTFIISGCPEGGDRETYRLVCIINDGGTQKIVIDSGDGNSVTLTSDDATIINNGFYLAVKSCDNKTFYPMLRLASIEDDTYEPYIEDTELDVTLPALPTLSGTNTLTVGTEVQPSNVYLKGRIKEMT